MSISIQLHISRQLTLPEGTQSRMCHTATALSLGPGQTQVTMFGGCPKWESGKTDDTQQKLAKTTVLEFGEQNTHDTGFPPFAISLLYRVVKGFSEVDELHLVTTILMFHLSVHR